MRKLPKKITEVKLFTYYLKNHYDVLMDFKMFTEMVKEFTDTEIINEE